MTENIEIEVDTLAIAYTADVKDVSSFHLSWGEWKNVFSNVDHPQKMEIEKSITVQQREEALSLKSSIETNWNLDQEKVVTWLEELTGWVFPPVTVRCVWYHFTAVRSPFRDSP